KWVFLICHSFQIACRHFNIGKISLRRSRQIGILPVHPLVNDDLFEGLKDPFYTLESRYYQITEPNDAAIAAMGASIIILEKERPSVPLERAIMGVKFNSHMYGVQFHPEADPSLLEAYFTQPEVKDSMIESFGELKWKKTHHSIKDPSKVEATFSIMIPNFLNKAIKDES
ncbi:MAG: glutamine amidotransferase-related protein, partial [Sediminibacterium sp.]